MSLLLTLKKHQRPRKRWNLTGALPTGLTFSRAGNATRFDETGTLCWAPANMITASEAVGISGSPGSLPAGWSTYTTGSGLTRTLTFGVLDTGMTYMDIRLVGTPVTSPAYQIILNRINGPQTGESYTHHGRIRLVGGSLTNVAMVNIGLNEATTSGSYLAGAEIPVSVGTTTPATPAFYTRVLSHASCAAVIPTIAIVGVLGQPMDLTLRIYNVQLERTSYNSPQAYNPTYGSAYYGPRFDYDPVTLQPRGLLVEESRTNILLRSSEFCVTPWTSFSMTCSMGSRLAPNGSYSGTDITASSVSASVSQQVSASASTTYTFSVWIKRISGASNIALRCYDGYTVTNSSVLFSGSDWERHSMTVTTGASATYLKVYVIDLSSSGWGTYSIWGAQLEAGRMASSYTPTSGLAATRAAEAVTGVVGPEFNPSQGTFVATAMVPYSVPANRSYLVGVSDGTGNNVIANLIETTGKPIGGNVIGGTVSISGGTLDGVQPYVPFTNIVAYKSGANVVSSGGVTDTAGAFGATGVPSGLNRYDFGCGTIANRNLNGWLQSVEYYPFAFNSVKANKESV